MRLLFTLLICITIIHAAYPQKKASSAGLPPALSAIKEADLKRDLFELEA